MKIPTNVLQAVRARWPVRAYEWEAAALPELVELCRAHGATPERVMPARYAFVVSAKAANYELILRSTADPDAPNQAVVAQALADIGVAPHIHETLVSSQAMWTVMDKVTPGTSLAESDPHTIDVAALTAPLRAMSEAPAPAEDLPSLIDWLRNRLRDDHLSDLPPGQQIANRAQRKDALCVLDELSDDCRDSLCHGDYSPPNVLTSADRQWQLIDPRGVRGEVEYDAAVLATKSFARCRRRLNRRHDDRFRPGHAGRRTSSRWGHRCMCGSGIVPT